MFGNPVLGLKVRNLADALDRVANILQSMDYKIERKVVRDDATGFLSASREKRERFLVRFQRLPERELLEFFREDDRFEEVLVVNSSGKVFCFWKRELLDEEEFLTITRFRNIKEYSENTVGT